MITAPPRFLLIAGPAGSGKSTWAPHLVPASFTLLGLDAVRFELPEKGYARPEFAARRILAQLQDECARRRVSFALEIRQPGRVLPRRLESLRRAGYVVQAVWLERAGGDESRAAAARRDFESRIAPVCDAWALLEQAGEGSRIIASGERAGIPPGDVYPAGFLVQNLRLAMREAGGHR